MPRKASTQAAEQPEPPAPAAEQVVQPAQERQDTDFAYGANAPKQEEPPKKKWTPPANPFGFEGKLGAEGNRVHLLKSEIKDDEGRVVDIAWVIRFDKPPNSMTGYSKENPHPVLKFLKENGFKWDFDPNDRTGGHGKICRGDPYGEEHIEARKVLEKAQEMIGGHVDRGIPI